MYLTAEHRELLGLKKKKKMTPRHGMPPAKRVRPWQSLAKGSDLNWSHLEIQLPTERNTENRNTSDCATAVQFSIQWEFGSNSLGPLTDKS